MEKQLIFERMAKVMQDVDFIGKDRKNTGQNYNFRGIDDVYNALHEKLAANQIFVAPGVIAAHHEERTSKSGSVLIYRIITMRYRFYTTDGSFVEMESIGEGMDPGDKSSNKAMSAAQKYALIQAFLIPTKEEKDSENDSHELKPGARKAIAPAPSSGDFIADHASPSQEVSTSKAKELADHIKAEAEKRTIDYKSFKTWLFTIQKDWKVANGGGANRAAKRALVLVGKKFGNLSLEEGKVEDLEYFIKLIGTKKDPFEAFIDHMSKEA
uniref:Putative Erf family protein n=1 Tax=viral metagenome TaxID=1070528 RepID=A0A6M3XB45_9ZZZZ